MLQFNTSLFLESDAKEAMTAFNKYYSAGRDNIIDVTMNAYLSTERVRDRYYINFCGLLKNNIRTIDGKLGILNSGNPGSPEHLTNARHK